MWDSNSPLQLLSSMPKKLTKENLEKLQLVIDADKYKNSLVSGFDLCGMYAPFCRGCKKTSIYPCAIAYINMMKAGGMEIEIDAKPLDSAEQTDPPAKNIPEEKVIEQEEEIAVAEETYLDETDANYFEPVKAVEETAEELVEEPQQPAQKPVKRKIRIAVAKRKI